MGCIKFACSQVLVLTFFACPAGAAEKAPLVMVYDRGSMQEMYKDNAAAKVKLAELKEIQHLYALGPLSELRGEILVWDSVPFQSRARNGQVQVKSDWGESAAFLVWSSVERWKKIAVPDSVQNYQMLDMWLKSMSGSSAAPLQSQFPFLLRGKLSLVNWHIVSHSDKSGTISPQSHDKEKYFGKSENIKVEILGFYSPAHQGLFIPRGRATHLHFRSGKPKDLMVAHLDNFEVGDNSLALYVPARK